MRPPYPAPTMATSNFVDSSQAHARLSATAPPLRQAQDIQRQGDVEVARAPLDHFAVAESVKFRDRKAGRLSGSLAAAAKLQIRNGDIAGGRDILDHRPGPV